MATHVATCHGGKMDNGVVEGQNDPLLAEEDVEGDDMMLGEEKKEGGRRRRKGGAGGKEGKQLQCSHCQLQLDSIGELRTHVKVSSLECMQILYQSEFFFIHITIINCRLCMRNRKLINALSATSKFPENITLYGTLRSAKYTICC